MSESMKFDYYYGMEAEQFSFYRVPRLLIKDKRFKGLSSDAKLLYGLMLDRMSLSIKNGWFDHKNRAYIHYTVEDIMEDLGCAKATCIKILAELDSKKGIGLIEKKRQGLGRPDIIYVKNFVVVQSPADQEGPEDKDPAVWKSMPETMRENSANDDISTEVQNLNLQKFRKQTSRSSKTEPLEVQKADFQKSKKQTSESSEIEPMEVQKLNPNYTNYNYTDLSYIYQSVSHADQAGRHGGMMDVTEDISTGMELIRENIEYEHYMNHADQKDRELYNELYEVICEIVCVPRRAVKVNGEEYPYEMVKEKFLKLNSSHLEYVISRMRSTASRITNIRAYMITALYNAPSTMNHYIQQEVMYDMYGGGWEEKGIV